MVSVTEKIRFDRPNWIADAKAKGKSENLYEYMHGGKFGKIYRRSKKKIFKEYHLRAYAQLIYMRLSDFHPKDFIWEEMESI